MKALKYTATFAPKPEMKLSEKEIRDKRAYKDSDKVFKDPKVELVDIPKPKITRPDQVLLKVMSCGICGSDLHFIETQDDGYIVYPGHFHDEQVLGHEFSGLVEEVGSDVVSLKPGDKVTVEEMKWCGVCDDCRNGYPNQCANLEEFGVTVDGGFAEYTVAEEKYCWKINDFANVYKDESKLWEAGTLVEPCSVAYNGVIECGGGFRPGAYVVIFGCGPIGLFSIAHCKSQGAAKVIVFEIIKERIELAKAMGADRIFNPQELGGKEPYEIIMDETEGKGADFFVEASGVAEIIFPQIENSLAAGAKVICTAMGAERIPIYMIPFHNRKGRIFASVGHSGYGNFMNVIRMISAGLFDPTKVVTARYKLDDILTALEAAKQRGGGKVIVEINR